MCNAGRQCNYDAAVWKISPPTLSFIIRGTSLGGAGAASALPSIFGVNGDMKPLRMSRSPAGADELLIGADRGVRLASSPCVLSSRAPPSMWGVIGDMSACSPTPSPDGAAAALSARADSTTLGGKRSIRSLLHALGRVRAWRQTRARGIEVSASWEHGGPTTPGTPSDNAHEDSITMSHKPRAAEPEVLPGDRATGISPELITNRVTRGLTGEI